MNFSKSIRFFGFITVLSFLVFNIWQIYETTEGIYNAFTGIGASDVAQSVGINPIILLIVIFPLIGFIFRLIGSILALQVVNLVLRKQTHKFSDLSNKISKVFLMEMIYLISITPNFFFITVIGTPTIFWSYIIQSALTIPFLYMLQRKIKNNPQTPFGPQVTKWIAITFLTYSIAIWVNHITRWFDMYLADGVSMLLASLNPLGFFNSAIVLSLAVVFAIIGFVKVKQKGILSKWIGASMTMMGTYFIILVIFYVLQNALNVLYLFELWTIPLFGLGLSIIFNNNK